MKRYQSGGPVPVPGKVPADGGRKSRMRDMISEEERKELDAPLRPEDFRRPSPAPANPPANPKMKKGGVVKRMAGGGMTRGDGCASRGKTKGRIV